MGGAVAAGFVA